MATLGKIRRMFFRDGLSLSEISRRTRLSRNTIKAWLRKLPGSEPRYQRARRPGKLAPYEATLAAALEADARRPKREGRSAWALFAHIKGQGYTGGYTLVSDFVRHWRSRGGKALVRAGPVRRRCGDPGSGVEHRLGDGHTQPLLRALRMGRADGEHPPLP